MVVKVCMEEQVMMNAVSSPWMHQIPTRVHILRSTENFKRNARLISRSTVKAMSASDDLGRSQPWGMTFWPEVDDWDRRRGDYFWHLQFRKVSLNWCPGHQLYHFDAPFPPKGWKCFGIKHLNDSKIIKHFNPVPILFTGSKCYSIQNPLISTSPRLFFPREQLRSRLHQ